MTPFDPAGPLPRGRALLEASAGTGKTWSIAALTLRYVAEEDIPIDRILAVTFTRAATSELRARIRSRLAGARRLLASGAGTHDPVVDHLADCEPVERRLRIGRIDRALRSYDRATITTLHGFAFRLLGEVGMVAGAPFGSELVDTADLLDEVVTDVWARSFAGGTSDPTTRLSDFRAIARSVIASPEALIAPELDTVDAEVAERVTLARDVRAAAVDRMRATGTFTYDDLLVAARDALAHPAVGGLARSLVGERYDVALVDEFQDTDRVQWETVDRLFPSDSSTLVIIGDPKQSIYAFRGADVTAYLSAAQASSRSHTLDTSWRSDGPLLRALVTVFDGVIFGDDRIAYRRVSPAPGRAAAALPEVGAPMEIRYVSRTGPVRHTTRSRLAADAAREFVADDVAASIVDVVSASGAPVRPGDIAVLCRTGLEVEAVRRALRSRSVPAVVGRTGSVFTSEAAGHWSALLAALELPSAGSRVRAVALTPFVGWTLAQLAAAGDEALLPLHEQIEDWATVLRESGVAGLWKEIERSREVTARVLSNPGGERVATDLDHLTELLHEAGRRGARSLHAWLVRRCQEATARGDGDETMSRRLETDADAVQILTIHASKGLEFPIVFVPYLYSVPSFPIDVPIHHDAALGRRVVAVGGESWDGHTPAKLAAQSDAEGEELRLAYVALTRARHHVRIWWAPVGNGEKAPLSSLLFARTDDGSFVEKLDIGSDRFLTGKLTALAQKSDGSVDMTIVDDWPHDRCLDLPDSDPAELVRAVFDRTIDRAWGRASFSSIASGAATIPTVDPPPTATLDEPDDTAIEDRAGESPLPMAGLPGGVGFGSLVHAVFEEIDFAHPDLDGALPEVCAEAVLRFGSTADPALLSNALLAVIRTPVTDGWRLAGVGRSEVVDEMEFELPLAVGGAPITTRVIGDRLDTALPPGHGLRPYVDRLRVMRGTGIRGFLTGSIDAVIRRADRYWVVDYKTNRLHAPGAEPTLADYRPDGLDEAMVHGDYVLQALLYQVALHRFLRSRLAGYDPDSHLGGSLYLFVRGMIGPDTPPGHGVHRWDAIPDLVESVSALFEVGE